MGTRLWIVTLGAIAISLVFAQAPLGQTAAKSAFVPAEQLDVAAVLPNPPSNESKQLAAEMAELHRLQDTRTSAQIERAKADDAQEDIFIFKDVIGEKFRREGLPLTALLSDHVHSNEGVIVNPAKAFFHRMRPYRFDTTLQPVCKMKTDPADYAYPSGHATSGYFEALVLVQIVPEKRDAILARADDYAHNRLICGVHYPSDIAASKSVAYATIGLMMNNPQFRKELEAAKTETRHVLDL